MIRIVNVNLAQDANSTILEHRLHKAIFGENTYNPDQVYESNEEAFAPDAPQPPPVLYEHDKMKCVDVKVFIDCLALEANENYDAIRLTDTNAIWSSMRH